LLAIWMDERKMSQSALADRCGVAEPTIGRWLKGARRPDAGSLAVLENVTGIAARLWAVPPMVDRPSRTGTEG
jgi:transcriptional regulator with XRE-family HTH domain